MEKLDATMCTKSDEEVGALVTGCLEACQAEWDSTQKANYLLNEQAANRDCTQEWLNCGQQCPPGVDTGEGIDYSQKVACENQCMAGYDNCEAAVSAAMSMMGVISSRLQRCACENCLIPYCRFFEDPDCQKTVNDCDFIQRTVTGSNYPESSKSYIGCGSSAGTAATLTQIAIGSTQGGGQQQGQQGGPGAGQTPETGQGDGQSTGAGQASGNQAAATQPAAQQTEKKASVVKAGLNVEGLKNSAKAEAVKAKVEEIQQTKQADKKDFVIEKSDSGKYELDFAFKLKYQLNKVSENYIDKIIEDIPLVNLLGTLIKAKKDDYVFESTEEKVKKNMVDHNTDYYGGKAMVHYDDAAEKKLSPAKTFFENVADKTVAPFKWTFDKLGGFFKSKSASSGSALYKEFEAQVKDNMRIGLSREDAISLTKQDMGDSDITSGEYGIYSRVTKDKDVNVILDNIANDLIEDGKI
jgi:hypothetical protein